MLIDVYETWLSTIGLLHLQVRATWFFILVFFSYFLNEEIVLNRSFVIPCWRRMVSVCLETQTGGAWTVGIYHEVLWVSSTSREHWVGVGLVSCLWWLHATSNALRDYHRTIIIFNSWVLLLHFVHFLEDLIVIVDLLVLCWSGPDRHSKVVLVMLRGRWLHVRSLQLRLVKRRLLCLARVVMVGLR